MNKIQGHLLFLLLIITSNLAIGQTDYISIHRFEDEKLIIYFNNSELLSKTQTDKLSIKIFIINNESGSAGFESGEVSYNLIIAVSEFDDYPKQSLFEIGAFYNPMKVTWTKNNFELIYGNLKEPKKKIFEVLIDNIKEME